MSLKAFFRGDEEYNQLAISSQSLKNQQNPQFLVRNRPITDDEQDEIQKSYVLEKGKLLCCLVVAGCYVYYTFNILNDNNELMHNLGLLHQYIASAPAALTSTSNFLLSFEYTKKVWEPIVTHGPTILRMMGNVLAPREVSFPEEPVSGLPNSEMYTTINNLATLVFTRPEISVAEKNKFLRKYILPKLANTSTLQTGIYITNNPRYSNDYGTQMRSPENLKNMWKYIMDGNLKDEDLNNGNEQTFYEKELPFLAFKYMSLTK